MSVNIENSTYPYRYALSEPMAQKGDYDFSSLSFTAADIE
jgi:hypothetical protein